ncbi:MAG: type IV pili methyl-accepting chemotaxis transducer N-terminal domain-containing protein, partial [Chromatiaceae bacterium]|nr:type IV pili methyl-accepting chemotaxis transducer N-terminal domain-containing protein [Chromatiaceae bacterium]
MPSNSAYPRHSLLLTIGLLMGFILALGLAAMIGAMLVAQVNQGMASAVNQSGTLRMQSYRIAAVLTDSSLLARERAERVRQLADELEQRLASPRLTEALPNAVADPLRIAYEQVAERWHQVMRPALKAEAIASGGFVYRAQVDAFVEQIHTLVRVLEDRAEQRIEGLAWMLAGALVLTLLAVLVTLWLLRRRVVRPLEALLQCADQVRQGDFSARTGFVGEDELGRLGAAMNLMTRGLWNIYNELEERVAEKTRDLARSNHSLQLLYRTSRALDGAMISDQTLRAVLLDLEREFKLASVTLCLRDQCSLRGAPTGNTGGGQPTGDAIGDQVGETVGNLTVMASAPPQRMNRARFTLIRDSLGDSLGDAIGDALDGELGDGLGDGFGDARSTASADSVGDSGLCIGTRQPLDAEGTPISANPPGSPCAICAAVTTAQNGSIIAVAVADQDRRYGTLRVVCRDGVPLESWQQPLLEALATQLATALNLQSRIRESRRLVLHEERSILARELHDSLAQSLSYLKIQAMRLDGAIKAPAANGQPSPEAILGELREGINSAYRQLRELLTTFRLKIDGQGLRAALAQTIDEFRARGDLVIRLDDQLPPGLLSPNEEVHVLQIVREALSNATRHARARTLKVRLDVDADSQAVRVEIRDDGCGIRST